jgi:hypothetical protein
MELDLIFQLVASTTATLCSVASLAFWLLYTEALSQGKRNKKQLIYSQIMIGGIIILGSVASMLLALKRTTADNGKQLCLLDDKSFLPSARSITFNICRGGRRRATFAHFERGTCR